MGITFAGLMYIQVMYMKNMVTLRDEYFSQGVKRSLYERAVGYDAKDVKQVISTDKATGRQEVEKTEVTTKHIAPDTMAIMYWLNNRSMGEFSQRQEITLGGAVKTSPMEKLTEEELRALARMDGEQDGEE